MLRFFLSLAIFVSATACIAVPDKKSDQTAKSEPTSVFACEVVDNMIHISFGRKHPSEMGVERPDGLFAYLKHRDFGQFVIYDENTDAISIDIENQKGDLDSGRGLPNITKIFDQPGKYVLIFSDNLETEIDNMDNLEICTVKIETQ